MRENALGVSLIARSHKMGEGVEVAKAAATELYKEAK